MTKNNYFIKIALSLFEKTSSHYSWQNPDAIEDIKNDVDHDQFESLNDHFQFWNDEENEDDEFWRDDKFDYVNKKPYNPNYLTPKKINEDKENVFFSLLEDCAGLSLRFILSLKRNLHTGIKDVDIKLNNFYKKYFDLIKNLSSKIEDISNYEDRTLKNYSLFNQEDAVDSLQDFFDDLVILQEILTYEFNLNKENNDLNFIIEEINNTISSLRDILLQINKTNILDTREDKKYREEQEKKSQNIPSAGEIDWRPTETIPEDYYAL